VFQNKVLAEDWKNEAKNRMILDQAAKALRARAIITHASVP
jgi:hypothetical protein